MDNEEIQQLIEDCLYRQSRMSDWEFNFIDSIENRETLSEKQLITLEKIWDRVTA